MNFIALSANCNHFWEFSILVIRTWMNDSNEKSLFKETNIKRKTSSSGTIISNLVSILNPSRIIQLLKISSIFNKIDVIQEQTQNKNCHMPAWHRGVTGLKIRVSREAGKKHDDVVCVKWVDWHLCASFISRNGAKMFFMPHLNWFSWCNWRFQDYPYKNLKESTLSWSYH